MCCTLTCQRALDNGFTNKIISAMQQTLNIAARALHGLNAACASCRSVRRLAAPWQAPWVPLSAGAALTACMLRVHPPQVSKSVTTELCHVVMTCLLTYVMIQCSRLCDLLRLPHLLPSPSIIIISQGLVWSRSLLGTYRLHQLPHASLSDPKWYQVFVMFSPAKSVSTSLSEAFPLRARHAGAYKC